MYRYEAEVVNVFDGDTVRLKIKLGFGLEDHGPTGKGRSFGLWGVDTPEIRGSSYHLGIAARDYVRSILTKGKKVIIQSMSSPEEFVHPYLVIIYIKEESGNLFNLNDSLINLGHAIKSEYLEGESF